MHRLKSILSGLKSCVKDDFYMELMPHNGAEVNKQLADLADEFKIQTVVTPDCHHVDDHKKKFKSLNFL
jgi:DNA polymerase III alpha subunit